MTRQLFKSGLVVSCQALPGNPLRDTDTLARMAHAAALGGACAIRANGAADIAAIRARTDLPLIGLDKRDVAPGRRVITPTFDAARAVIAAGATVVAAEMTASSAGLRDEAADLIARIHDELGAAVMADIATFEEGVAAARLGADLVSTTMSGYAGGPPMAEIGAYTPDFPLLERLAAARLGVPVVAEGRFWTLDDVRKAFALGAYAVVIGKAITNPMAATRYFAQAVPPHDAAT